MLKRAFPFFLSGIFATMYFRIDVTLMSKLVPLSLIGYYENTVREAVIGWYSASYNLFDAASSIAQAISAAILPVAVILFKESQKKFTELANMSIRYLLYITIPIAFGTTVLAEKFIELIYGPEYFLAALSLKILIWALIPLGVNYVFSTIIISMHKEKKALIVLGSIVVVNILSNLILIPLFSLYGAAFSTVFTELIYFIGYYVIILKDYKAIPFWNHLLKPLVSSVLMFFVLLFFNTYNVFILILLGIFTYLISMFLLRAFSFNEITHIVKMVKSK